MSVLVKIGVGQYIQAANMFFFCYIWKVFVYNKTIYAVYCAHVYPVTQIPIIFDKISNIICVLRFSKYSNMCNVSLIFCKHREIVTSVEYLTWHTQFNVFLTFAIGVLKIAYSLHLLVLTSK
jgi:hypothetical protein